jgi:hypothetical protein
VLAAVSHHCKTGKTSNNKEQYKRLSQDRKPSDKEIKIAKGANPAGGSGVIYSESQKLYTN